MPRSTGQWDHTDQWQPPCLPIGLSASLTVSAIGRQGEGRPGVNRVNRGGSWNNNARNVRAANRDRNRPSNRNANIGFRLASS